MNHNFSSIEDDMFTPLVEPFPGVNNYNTTHTHTHLQKHVFRYKFLKWGDIQGNYVDLRIILGLRLLRREYQSFPWLILFFSFFFWLLEMCLFTEKNIYSFKQTVFQGSMHVCYFGHGGHSGEPVIGIQREGDYVTARIHKPSIGPYYLPNQALSLLFIAPHNIDPIPFSKR